MNTRRMGSVILLMWNSLYAIDSHIKLQGGIYEGRVRKRERESIARRESGKEEVTQTHKLAPLFLPLSLSLSLIPSLQHRPSHSKTHYYKQHLQARAHTHTATTAPSRSRESKFLCVFGQWTKPASSSSLLTNFYSASAFSGFCAKIKIKNRKEGVEIRLFFFFFLNTFSYS